MAAQKEILRLERQQVADFNHRRISALLKPFARSFVGFSSTRHRRIAGLGPLKQTFQHYLGQSPRVSYRIAQPRVQVYGASAVASFYWTVKLGRRAIRGRGSHVFAKHGKRWYIVHEHFSRAH